MTHNAGAGSQSTGRLSVDGQPPANTGPLRSEDVGADNVQDQFSAVINIHDCDLHQIEVAVAANQHEVDPHPAAPGKYLRRHPVYIGCWDHSQTDDQGRPLPGKPRELNEQMIRDLFSARHPWVASTPPPADGSHVRVRGMHTIAELDSAGNPTGRVRFGSPDEVAQP